MADDQDLDAAIARATEPLLRQIAQLRDSAARVSDNHRAEVAAHDLNADDLRRLAALDAERQATDVAEKVVTKMLTSLGLDPTKADSLRQDLVFLHDTREGFSAAKRHGLFVFIAVVVAGFAAGFWQMLKGAKP